MSLTGRVLLGLVVLLVSLPAKAVSEYRGYARTDERLYSGPGSGYDVLETKSLAKREEILVLGNSVGGGWTLVLCYDGTEGWVPTGRLELVRVVPSEFDRFELLVQRKRRATSRWMIHAGVQGGTGTLGFGVGGMIYLNTARDGLFGKKSDQLEIGTGFNIYLGQASPTAARKAFGEVPISVLWLGRFGGRGALLVGPRLGASVIADPAYPTGTRAVPFVGGLHARYYPDEDYGFYWESLVMSRSVQYVVQTVGLSLRF